ncbi:MAG: OmpH family outer membrane protein [Desulfovibrionaceae bacterium]|nr:OmpH family outer membrane protein [Desulfovibrionaceae bacterium]
MKKSLIACLAMAALVSLAACNQPAGTGIKLVDAAKVFKECKAGQEGMDYLRDLSQNLQAEAKDAQDAVQKDQSEENAAKFQEAIAKYQSTMAAEQQRIVGTLNKNFNEVLDAYRAEKKIDLILNKQTALSQESGIDVTDDIIAKMNNLTIEVLPAEQKAAAAPAAEPAKTEAKTEAPAPAAEPAKQEAAAPAAEPVKPEAKPEAKTEAPAPAKTETPAN